MPSPRTHRFIGSPKSPERIRLYAYVAPTPIAGPPTTDDRGHTTARGGANRLYMFTWFAAAAVFAAASLFMIDTPLRYNYHSPMTDTPNRSPVRNIDAGAILINSIMLGAAAYFAFLGAIYATSKIHLDLDPSSRELHITRSRLATHTERSVPISRCTLFVAPHVETIYGRYSTTLHFYKVQLAAPDCPPIVLFASDKQRTEQARARAAIEAARTWMQALDLDCLIYPDEALQAATTSRPSAS